MPLTRIFGCKHIEALLNCEILFPNIVQLNNHRRMLRYFYVDLEPWSSTSIQEASSGRSATILRRFMNLEHMCTCGKAKKSSPWDVHVMELPKSKTCLFVGVSNRIAAIINSLKWVQQFELPNKQFAICWASRVTSRQRQNPPAVVVPTVSVYLIPSGPRFHHSRNWTEIRGCFCECDCLYSESWFPMKIRPFNFCLSKSASTCR